MNNVALRKLSQKDIDKLYDYLLFFEKIAIPNYGNFNWDWIKSNSYITDNDIQIKCEHKNHKTNYFRFKTHKVNGINDYGYHFIRHIRNAFAHGNIQKGKTNTFFITDYRKRKDGTLELSMSATIKAEYFWTILNIVKESLNK